MEISKGVKIVDVGLKIGKHLIIADLHIGFEEALSKQGIFMPRFQFNDTIKKLNQMILVSKPEIIVVNGDLKHEFGTISMQEWRETLKVLDLLLQNSKRVILIKGNHDTIIGPIAKKRNVDITDNFLIEEGKKKILVMHGHVEPDKKLLKNKNIDLIIMGHEHPAISLREGAKTETYKCFLKGEYHKKELIVMPSFNPVTEGADILKEKLLSPLLNKRIDDFEVYVVSDRTYFFGKVRNIR
ncbi:MAG: metallophosphoesterase [Candidatus Woesearchaeota archaeon]|nr:metallophosphoesterase [Candidatus Woesearchaeota archaeon]